MEQQQKISTNFKFPKFLIVLFMIEVWERFSYYGMQALLVLYLTKHLGFADKRAYYTYSLFAALAYAGPVIGGYLADKLMGFRKMAIIGGIVISIGHAVMSTVEMYSDLIYLGLALIAVGTGMFKGNITNLLGACYENDDNSRDRGFTIFYVGVNIGSASAAVICSYVADMLGWHYGFALAGIGMLFGLFIFINFQHVLGDHGNPPNPELMNKSVILGIKPFPLILIGNILAAIVVAYLLRFSEIFANFNKYFSFIIIISLAYSAVAYIIMVSDGKHRKNLIALSILTVFMTLFFALEMQVGSLINFFADRNVVKTVFGLSIPASVSQAINPFSIIVFGTIMFLFVKVDLKYTIARFAFGLMTMVLCFMVLFLGCTAANEESRVGYIYLVTGITFMGIGELCIGPFVQAQCTVLAPKKLRGFFMGVVHLSIAIANLGGFLISEFMSVPSVNGVVDSEESLRIYKEGFLNIAQFNSIFVVAFLAFYPFLYKVITEQTKKFRIHAKEALAERKVLNM